MALEGTHIRFALAFAAELSIQDYAKYVSGTIYPDSRYVTGVLRDTTHPKDFTLALAGDSDFMKGWYMHLLCDRLTREVYFDWFAHALSGGSIKGGNAVWIETTAIKILQDMEDIQKFAIVDYLPSLDYAENPNGEDILQIRLYNSMIQKMYTSPSTVTLDYPYASLWLDFGLSEGKKRELLVKCIGFRNDSQITNRVGMIFDETIRRAKAFVV